MTTSPGASMTPSANGPVDDAVSDDLRDPWDRYGWVMGSIWLVFLVFPIVSTVNEDNWWPWRALTVLAVIAFGAAVGVGFARLGRACTEQARYAVGRQHLLVMLVLFLLTIPVAGWASLGMIAFFVSLSWFALPVRGAFAVFTGCLAVTVAAPAIGGVLGQAWYFVLIVGGVGIATGLIRVLDDRQAEHQEFSTHLALSQDRERVARDVHDVLGHSLTVITLKAELAERLLEVDPQRAAAEVHQIRDISRQALAEIRATVGGLRVARLADEVAAATSVLADAGIGAQMPADAEVVDPRHRIVLAWAVREAVTNVVRHSGADHCRVELGPSSLTVSDDGRGMSNRREGNGIRGLRERVGSAGGTLDLRAGPDGRGTTLEVML